MIGRSASRALAAYPFESARDQCARAQGAEGTSATTRRVNGRRHAACTWQAMRLRFVAVYGALAAALGVACGGRVTDVGSPGEAVPDGGAPRNSAPEARAADGAGIPVDAAVTLDARYRGRRRRSVRGRRRRCFLEQPSSACASPCRVLTAYRRLRSVRLRMGLRYTRRRVDASCSRLPSRARTIRREVLLPLRRCGAGPGLRTHRRVELRPVVPVRFGLHGDRKCRLPELPLHRYRDQRRRARSLQRHARPAAVRHPPVSLQPAPTGQLPDASRACAQAATRTSRSFSGAGFVA